MRIISRTTEQPTPEDRLDCWRQRWMLREFRAQIMHMGHRFSNFKRVDELLDFLAPRKATGRGREARPFIRVMAEAIGFVVMVGAGVGLLIYVIGLVGVVTGID